MAITPSLRHCSNKYKLAREGEKDKENDEDFEKIEIYIYIFIYLFFHGLVLKGLLETTITNAEIGLRKYSNVMISYN